MEDNPCDPVKLCTFAFEAAAKEFILQTYLRNSQVTRKAGKRDGVRYGGQLYDAAVAQAQADHPDATPAQRAAEAAANLDKLIAQRVNSDAFRPPPCRLDGTVDDTLRPKAGYTGMSTTSKCQVIATFEAGEFDAASFGSGDRTNCKEFYDRDRAHERIHQLRCEAARNAGESAEATRNGIDAHIEEEIAAYKHSVKLSKAYVRLLAFQCSDRVTPAGLQSRAREIESQLGPYLQKP